MLCWLLQPGQRHKDASVDKCLKEIVDNLWKTVSKVV